MKLTPLETACLKAWSDASPDYGYLSFRVIGMKCTVPQHNVRRVTRALARKGLVQYAKGLWDDDGQMRGAGYGLTAEGWKYFEKDYGDDDRRQDRPEPAAAEGLGQDLPELRG